MDDYLSTIRVPLDKVPAAKSWKVGQKYRLDATVEMTGIKKERDYGYYDDEGPVSLSKARDRKPRYHTMVEFKVQSIGSEKDKALKKRLA